MSRQASLSEPAVIVRTCSAGLLAILQRPLDPRIVFVGLTAQIKRGDLWEEMWERESESERGRERERMERERERIKRERERMEREERERRSEVRDELDGWPWGEREYNSPSVCFFLLFPSSVLMCVR